MVPACSGGRLYPIIGVFPPQRRRWQPPPLGHHVKFLLIPYLSLTMRANITRRCLRYVQIRMAILSLIPLHVLRIEHKRKLPTAIRTRHKIFSHVRCQKFLPKLVLYRGRGGGENMKPPGEGLRSVQQQRYRRCLFLMYPRVLGCFIAYYPRHRCGGQVRRRSHAYKFHVHIIQPVVHRLECRCIIRQ